MANELTFRLRRALSMPSIFLGGSIETVHADLGVAFSKTIPALTTDAEIIIALTLAEVLIMGMEADQGCVVKTNSILTPRETLTLTANHPLIWATGDLAGGKFFAGDVTAFYVTTGAQQTLLKFVAGLNATPVLSD
jgi:hypothetical protein